MLSTVLAVLKYRKTYLAQPFKIVQELQQPGLFCDVAGLFTKTLDMSLDVIQRGREQAAESLGSDLFAKLASIVL
jgi:hypothetical protein